MNCIGLYIFFAENSLLTFGGGYAMISLFQNELVNRMHLIESEEYANLVAIAQITPGPVGMNTATYIGYDQHGLPGAISATLGIMTPSLVLTLIVAYCFSRFRNSKTVAGMLGVVRPVVIGIIASAVLFFADNSILTRSLRSIVTGALPGVNLTACVIFAATVIIHWKWKVNSIWMLLGSGVAGYLFSLVK